MSNEYVTDFVMLMKWRAAVIADGRLTASVRLTAIALADHLNLQTGQLNPSSERIAACTAQSRFGVQKQIERLCDAAWAKKITTTKGRTSNAYALATANIGLAVEPPTYALAVKPSPDSPTANGQSSNRQRREPQPPTNRGATANQLVGTNSRTLENSNKNRGTPTLLPADWPNAQDRDYAVGLWKKEGRDDLVQDIDAISRKAVLWHQQTQKRFKNWRQRWQQWALKQLDFEPRRQPQQKLTGMHSAMKGMADVLMAEGGADE